MPDEVLGPVEAGNVPRFERMFIQCPRCGSRDMEERHLREMWQSNRPKKEMPLYGAASEMRVTCYHCGMQVWPEATEQDKKHFVFRVLEIVTSPVFVQACIPRAKQVSETEPPKGQKGTK